IFSWVFFKAENLTDAIHYIQAMVNPALWHTTQFQYQQVLVDSAFYALPLGIILSQPVYRIGLKKLLACSRHSNNKKLMFIYFPGLSVVSVLLILCAAFMAASTYNPFIYFRF